MHVVGTIAWGHFDCYFIMNADQKKDSNMECTVVSRTLDLVNNKLASKAHAMPRSLIVNPDNTTREAKNQHFFTYMSYLKATGKMDATQVEFAEPGHTHNEQDRNFAGVASCLSKAPILENPEEFEGWMKVHVRPQPGHELHVEILTETRDFQSWCILGYGGRGRQGKEEFYPGMGVCLASPCQLAGMCQ